MLQGTSPCVVLTGAAGLGKTTVLAAALSYLAKPGRQVLRLDDMEVGIEKVFNVLFASARQRPDSGPIGADIPSAAPSW